MFLFKIQCHNYLELITHIHVILYIKAEQICDRVHKLGYEVAANSLVLHRQQGTVWCYAGRSAQFSVTQIAVYSLVLHRQQRTVWCHAGSNVQFGVTQVAAYSLVLRRQKRTFWCYSGSSVQFGVTQVATSSLV